MRNALRPLSALALLGLITLVAGSAFAGEGQIEINQAAALAGAITPGDAPGFPVTLDRPGSYRLTSDLLVRSADTTGIQISARDVTLEMAGFSLRCEVPNVPVPIPCSVAGGTGIGVQVNSAQNTRLQNGTIREFARHGVLVTQSGSDYQISDLRVYENGETGLLSQSSGQITGSAFVGNGIRGIDVRRGSALILDSMTRDNTVPGIYNDPAATTTIGRSVVDDGMLRVFTSNLVDCTRISGTMFCP